MAGASRTEGASAVCIIIHVIDHDGGRHIREPLEVVAHAGAEETAVNGRVHGGHARELAVELGHVRLVTLWRGPSFKATIEGSGGPSLAILLTILFD